MSFDERLGLLVDAEWMARENDRVGRALKEAKLCIAGAAIEGIDDAPARELDRTLMRQLASGKWVHEHQTVIVTGATGTGKTDVSCVLAQQACRKGFRALYRRAPRFFDELRRARVDGSYPRLLARVARVDVLVLDDFALAPVTDLERRERLEVLEDRYGVRSTVISSQLPPDPLLGASITDKLLEVGHVVGGQIDHVRRSPSHLRGVAAPPRLC